MKTLHALALGAVLACTPRMKVDPALADAAEAYPVTGAAPRGWSRPLGFGPWNVSPAPSQRGWSAELLGLPAAAPYALRMEGPAGVVEVECRDGRLEGLAPFGVPFQTEAAPGKPVLACALRPQGAAGAAGAWSFAIRAAGEGPAAYAGELRNGAGVSLTVRSVHALVGGSAPRASPVGWTIDRGGITAAAVETLGQGRVIISRRDPAGHALAAAAAALLLAEVGGR